MLHAIKLVLQLVVIPPNKTKMKNLVMLLFMLGVSLSGFAQRGDGRKMKASPEKRTEMRLKQLEKKLGLTADQRSKLQPSLLALEKERESLTSDAENVRARKIELMKKADQTILEVLTAEQKVTYEKLKAERKAKMRERMEDRMLENEGM